ncbi:Hypothetical protein, putative [Bodo saltans]|uniref:EF-hand domain-containing protein n=1 Tax=Bodo saltans TaxID=75058 RepID=A0A0S4IIH5_BODSA|nr:Hypothetical protein, putative [Bodo saltans]|eukprot:CUE71819.1 Hypothetical protein, putative [Bodo saltans]
MFKLKLPIRGDGEEGGGRSPILSEDAQEVESHNSSQSLYDFDEDASSDAAEAGEEEDEDAEEIDLETMEAVFDNDTRQIIIEYEQELNLQDEEWLLANSHADPELIASELTDREVKKQKKLYNLRRQKFYELGGRKKTRNIMMRYGITHLKLLKEQHTDGAGGDYSAVETHPRSVSNSILLHLKYGIDLVRIEWLKIVFRMLAKKQKSEAIDAKRYDVLPALVAEAPSSKSIPSSSAVTGGSSSPQLFKQRNSNGGGGGDSEASPLQPAITRSSSLSWMDADTAGFSLRIPDETPEGATPTNAAVVAAASPTVTAVSDDDPNKAYMQRRKAAGASSNNNNSNAVASSSNDNNNHHNSNNDPPKRIPSNGVDESNFAQGMLCFFELLARHDRRRRLVERELRRLQRQAAANSSGDASGVAAAAAADVAAAAMEEAAESAKAELFSTLATAFDPAANFELPPDDTSDLDKSVVMSRATSFVLGNSSTASIAAFAASRRSSMVHAPPAGKTAAQSAPATQDEDEDGDEASPNGGGGGGGGPDDDGRKKFVGRDFLARSNDIIDAGFRFLFCAVDANDNGFITWDALLEYLLDATLLAKAADQTLTSRDYEFVRHHHTSAFTELNDVCLVPARSMFVIGGVHATIIGNKTTSSSTAQQQAGEEAERDNNQAGKKVATLFPERNVIQTPIDPLTFVPQYKVTALCHMASLKMLAIVGSDSTVRIYTLHSVAHPRMIASARFDSNSRTILWFKDLLFIGTRLGTLYSFRMSHSKTGGWQLRPHKQCHSHSGDEGISRIIAIPMESCVCTASYDRSMVLHDAKSLTIVHRFSKEHAQGISDMCYCSCINGLATVSFDHKIMVWMVSLLHNKPILLTDSVRDHVGTLISVSCVEHSQSLVTLDTKGMVKIWGLRNFLCIQTISAASFVPVQDVGAHFFKVVVYHSPPSVVLPLGSTQLHLFSRRRLFVFEYNLSQRNVVLRNTADDEPVVYVGYNYIEQLYITFSINSVRIWEAATCAIRDTFRCTTVEEHGGISSAYLHPNGRAYYVGTHRGSIFAKNFSTGTTMFVARCHRGPSLSLRFCYAATVAARVTAATTTASATTKAGLGDIIVSIRQLFCAIV